MNKEQNKTTERYDNAIKHYGRAIELKPDFAEAYSNRGIVHAKKGDHDQAIRDFNQADAIACFNRGVVWLPKQAWDKAKSDLKAAKEKGLNIAKLFSDTFGSVSAFEKQHHIQLPKDIRDMLTE